MKKYLLLSLSSVLASSLCVPEAQAFFGSKRRGGFGFSSRKRRDERKQERERQQHLEQQQAAHRAAMQAAARPQAPAEAAAPVQSPIDTQGDGYLPWVRTPECAAVPSNIRDLVFQHAVFLMPDEVESQDQIVNLSRDMSQMMALLPLRSNYQSAHGYVNVWTKDGVAQRINHSEQFQGEALKEKKVYSRISNLDAIGTDHIAQTRAAHQKQYGLMGLTPDRFVVGHNVDKKQAILSNMATQFATMSDSEAYVMCGADQAFSWNHDVTQWAQGMRAAVATVASAGNLSKAMADESKKAQVSAAIGHQLAACPYISLSVADNELRQNYASKYFGSDLAKAGSVCQAELNALLSSQAKLPPEQRGLMSPVDSQVQTASEKIKEEKKPFFLFRPFMAIGRFAKKLFGKDDEPQASAIPVRRAAIVDDKPLAQVKRHESSSQASPAPVQAAVVSAEEPVIEPPTPAKKIPASMPVTARELAMAKSSETDKKLAKIPTDDELVPLDPAPKKPVMGKVRGSMNLEVAAKQEQEGDKKKSAGPAPVASVANSSQSRDLPSTEPATNPALKLKSPQEYSMVLDTEHQRTLLALPEDQKSDAQSFVQNYASVAYYTREMMKHNQAVSLNADTQRRIDAAFQSLLDTGLLEKPELEEVATKVAEMSLEMQERGYKPGYKEPEKKKTEAEEVKAPTTAVGAVTGSSPGQ